MADKCTSAADSVFPVPSSHDAVPLLLPDLPIVGSASSSSLPPSSSVPVSPPLITPHLHRADELEVVRPTPAAPLSSAAAVLVETPSPQRGRGGEGPITRPPIIASSIQQATPPSSAPPATPTATAKITPKGPRRGSPPRLLFYQQHVIQCFCFVVLSVAAFVTLTVVLGLAPFDGYKLFSEQSRGSIPGLKRGAIPCLLVDFCLHDFPKTTNSDYHRMDKETIKDAIFLQLNNITNYLLPSFGNTNGDAWTNILRWSVEATNVRWSVDTTNVFESPRWPPLGDFELFSDTIGSTSPASWRYIRPLLENATKHAQLTSPTPLTGLISSTLIDDYLDFAERLASFLGSPGDFCLLFSVHDIYHCTWQDDIAAIRDCVLGMKNQTQSFSASIVYPSVPSVSDLCRSITPFSPEYVVRLSFLEFGLLPSGLELRYRAAPEYRVPSWLESSPVPREPISTWEDQHPLFRGLSSEVLQYDDAPTLAYIFLGIGPYIRNVTSFYRGVSQGFHHTQQCLPEHSPFEFTWSQAFDAVDINRLKMDWACFVYLWNRGLLVLFSPLLVIRRLFVLLCRREKRIFSEMKTHPERNNVDVLCLVAGIAIFLDFRPRQFDNARNVSEALGGLVQVGVSANGAHWLLKDSSAVTRCKFLLMKLIRLFLAGDDAAFGSISDYLDYRFPKNEQQVVGVFVVLCFKAVIQDTFVAVLRDYLAGDLFLAVLEVVFSVGIGCWILRETYVSFRDWFYALVSIWVRATWPLHSACLLPQRPRSRDDEFQCLVDVNETVLKKPISSGTLRWIDGDISLHFETVQHDLDSLLGALPLHLVCANTKSGLARAKLLFSRCREAAKVSTAHNILPLHFACGNPSLNKDVMFVRSLILEHPEGLDARIGVKKDGNRALEIAKVSGAGDEVVGVLELFSTTSARELKNLSTESALSKAISEKRGVIERSKKALENIVDREARTQVTELQNELFRCERKGDTDKYVTTFRSLQDIAEMQGKRLSELIAIVMNNVKRDPRRFHFISEIHDMPSFDEQEGEDAREPRVKQLVPPLCKFRDDSKKDGHERSVKRLRVWAHFMNDEFSESLKMLEATFNKSESIRDICRKCGVLDERRWTLDQDGVELTMRPEAFRFDKQASKQANAKQMDAVCRLKVGPPKELARALAKAKEGKELKDLNRATFEFEDPLLMALMFECIRCKRGWKVVSVKNKHKDEVSEPPDLHINIDIGDEHNKWLVEIQLMFCDILVIKQELHKFYRITRAEDPLDVSERLFPLDDVRVDAPVHPDTLREINALVTKS